MRTTSITEKSNLDITGTRNRQKFLSAYTQELQHVPTAQSVKESYSSWIHNILGSSPYLFVSVNLTFADIRKALEKEQKHNAGILPVHFIPLAQDFYKAIRSGISSQQDAITILWNKFLVRLNQKVLGAKFKRYGHSLQCIGFHENETKRYSTEPANHLHMLVEVPVRQLSPEYDELKFKNTFRELFSHLIYPSQSDSKDYAVLNIVQARMTGCNPHPKYILKQIVNWETASDRIFTSGIPKLDKQ